MCSKKINSHLHIFHIIILTFCVIILFDRSGYGKDSVNLGLIGQWGYQGAVLCVEITENDEYAYCGTEEGLMIVDISDPNVPEELAMLSLGRVNAIRFYQPTGYEKYAVLGVQNHGLVILDIKNPIEPVYEGVYSGLESPRDLAVIDRYVYVADIDKNMAIIDITDPTKPAYVGGYDTKGTTHGISVFGSYAYMADGENGLVIIDIIDPIKPVYVGGYRIESAGEGKSAEDVVISGHYAYVTYGVDGLIIIDIQNPINPVKAGGCDTAVYARGIAISDHHAFVADWYNGVTIIDIANPNTPVHVGQYDTDGSTKDLTISGDYAYVADLTKGLIIIDISHPNDPGFVGGETKGSVTGVALSDNYVYLTVGSRGLMITDVRDPTAPAFIGQYDTHGNALNLAISGQYVYLADETYGIVIVDVSDPYDPVFVGGYDPPGRVFDIHVSQDYAFVVNEDGLLVIDISNPNDLTCVGTYDTNGRARGVTISGDYAYVADYNKGLIVIDISNPTTPLYLGGYDTDGFAQSLAVSGDYAYVADGDNGLVIIDIHDPNRPEFKGSYQTKGFAQDVFIMDPFAYVADGDNGLTVIDIKDPNTPVFAGGYDTRGYARSLAISENMIYEADGDNGLLVFRILDTLSPKGNLVLCPSGPASISNILWAPSQGLANLAYMIFQDQNYPHYFVYYLNPNPYQDIDGDGLTDPFVVDDFDPSLSDLNYALTDWATNRLNTGPLYLYLPGLGTQNAYQILPDIILPASDPNHTDHLKSYLDGFQQETGRDAICVLEFLSSGSFCDALLDPNIEPYSRSIISCTDEGISYLDPEGKQSFTGRFFQLLQDSNQSVHLFSDTNTSQKQRVEYIQAIFSEARSQFWKSGYPFNTQPPQMVTSLGSHTLYGMTLSVDPNHSAFDYTQHNQITIADPGHMVTLRSVGHYLNGNEDLHDRVYYHVSDPFILKVTQEGDVYANPNTNYNGMAYVLGTIIDPNFIQAPDHPLDMPSLGGVTGRISIKVEMADRREKEDLPKAIIVAGRLNDPTGYDYLWESSSRIATHAYHTFIDRGYGPDNIYYMSHDPNQPGADGPSSGETFYDILDGIFTDPNNPYLRLEGLTDLTMVLIDHGKKDRFVLGPEDDQVLTPYILNQWLDHIQGKYPSAEITVMIEACYSGGFLAPLMEGAQNRVVITSTQETAAYLAANGWVSFSYFLLNYLKGGDNLLDAFEKAHTDIASLSWGGIQHPLLEDRDIAAQKSLGGSFVLSQGQPQILQVSEFQDPNDPVVPNEPIQLWARVADLDGVEDVWAIISHSQGALHFSGSLEDPLMLVDLPKIDLEYNPMNDRFESMYEGFAYSGPHAILFLARDATGMVSYPKAVYVNVEGSHQDYAFLVYDPNAMSAYADFTEWVLQKRRFPNDDIYKIENIEGLDSALTILADNLPERLHHLILYFIHPDDLSLLDANTLCDQLDQIQQDTNCTVITMIDTDESGRFLPGFKGEKRILISSTDPNHPATPGGMGAPFSQFFFSNIYNGVDVNQAFHAARFAIGYYSAQNPQLDDNGNGIGLEYGFDYDGKFAGQVYLGSPFEPVSAGPRITVPTVVHINGWETSTATIWAQVQDPNSFVWAVVIPPHGVNDSVVLTYDPNDERFEMDYAFFSQQGIYRVVAYVQEPEGLLDYDESPYIVLMPDAYEADNDPNQAGLVMVNQSPQSHNFHRPDDMDWIYFYGYAMLPYEVRAAKVWADCQLLIEVFDTDLNPIGYASPYAVGFSAPQDGFYFVRVSYTCPLLPTTEPFYALSVVCPQAGTGGVWGWVRDQDTGNGIVGAQVCTPVNQCVASMEEWDHPGGPIEHVEEGFYFMDALPQASGGLELTAEAQGYLPTSHVITDYNENLVPLTFYLERDPCQTPGDPIPDPDALEMAIRYLLGKSDEINVTIPLHKGFNLFVHPSAAEGPPYAYYSGDFLWTNEPGYMNGGPDHFSCIRRYNPITRTQEVCCFEYIDDEWWITGSTTFPIVSNESNPVYMLEEKTLEFPVPIPNPPIDLKVGINYVGIPFPPSDYTSYTMLQDIRSHGEVVSICGFDPQSARWRKAYWQFQKPAGDHFPIQSGQGYLVFMKEGIDHWYPGKTP